MCVHPIDISEDALMPTIDPREFGLVQPAYDIADEEVKRGVGNPTTVYKEAGAGRLKLTKRGRRTILLAPDFAAYLKMLRDRTDRLLRSPNPKARR